MTALTAPTTAPHALRSGFLLTGATGLVLVATSLFATVPEPEDGAARDSLRGFYESHLGATGVAVLMGTLAMGAFLLLLVGLRRLMSEHGVKEMTLDLTRIAGTLVAIWYWLTSSGAAMVQLMAEDGKLDQYDDTSLATLDLFSRLTEAFGDIGMLPIGLFIGAVSFGAVRTRFVPRWIGQFGLIVAAAAIASLFGAVWPGSVTSTAFFTALFGFVLWTLILSVALVVLGLRGRRS